jgi:hypothetical protein
MPKTKIDYSKLVIYKIVCNDMNVHDIYVGSTTDFTKRKTAHKHNCKSNVKNYKLYNIINTNHGWDNWSMIEIEKFPCNDGNEARGRERFWYEQLNASLNSQKPLKTKSDIQTYNQTYYLNNKNKISDATKQYAEDNKEKVKEYRKKYREEHKEKQKEYMKEYYKNVKSI